MTPPPLRPPPLRIATTAGPTHEPIDEVRFIGNRSSGRLGVAVADEAARRGLASTLMLGPSCVEPGEPSVVVRRFRSSRQLEEMLATAGKDFDVLIMAAAVCDYRPIAASDGKLRRGGSLKLELAATPDLIAGVCGRTPRPGVVVAFALEPAEGLEASARAKLARKRADLIVANPLETMDSGLIDATILSSDGRTSFASDGPMNKAEFAKVLIDVALAHHARHAGGNGA